MGRVMRRGRQLARSRRWCGSGSRRGGVLVVTWLVLWGRVVYRRWRLVMIVSAGLAPSRWRGTIISILIVGGWRTIRSRRSGLLGVIMVRRRWRRWRSMFIRITATVIVLSVIGGRLSWGSRGDLLLWLRLLVLSRGSSFRRGWLNGRGGCRNRGGARPRGDKMRGPWLGDIVTSIGNNFAYLFDLLSLDIPNQAYPATFLLFWFILGLL